MTKPTDIIADAIREAEFAAAATARTPADTVVFPTGLAKVAANALTNDAIVNHAVQALDDSEAVVRLLADSAFAGPDAGADAFRLIARVVLASVRDGA